MRDHLLASGIAAALATTVAITTEHITLLAILAAGISTVIGAVTWVEKKIEKKISSHESREFEKYEAREKLEAERHARIMAEIGHVKEMVDIEGKLRQLLTRKQGEGE